MMRENPASVVLEELPELMRERSAQTPKRRPQTRQEPPSLNGPTDASPTSKPKRIYTGRSLAQCRNIVGSIKWLWPSWIQSQGLTIIAGPSGSGKTTFGLWIMVRCAIMGGQFPDRTSSQPQSGKKILLLLAEPVISQVSKLASDYHLDEAAFLFPEGPRLDVVEPVRLNSRTWPEIEALAAREDVFAIGLDSLHAALSGLDRSKPESSEPIIERFQALSMRLHKPVILIAHTKKIGDAKLKKGAYTDIGIDPLELISGSSEIGFAVDTVIGILKLGDGSFRISPWKTRSADTPKPLDATMLPDEHEILFGPSPEARAEHGKQTEAANWIVGIIASHGGQITRSVIRDLATKDDIHPRTLSRAALRLETTDKIHRNDTNWVLGPDPASRA